VSFFKLESKTNSHFVINRRDLQSWESL